MMTTTPPRPRAMMAVDSKPRAKAIVVVIPLSILSQPALPKVILIKKLTTYQGKK